MLIIVFGKWWCTFWTYSLLLTLLLLLFNGKDYFSLAYHAFGIQRVWMVEKRQIIFNWNVSACDCELLNAIWVFLMVLGNMKNVSFLSWFFTFFVKYFNALSLWVSNRFFPFQHINRIWPFFITFFPINWLPLWKCFIFLRLLSENERAYSFLYYWIKKK